VGRNTTDQVLEDILDREGWPIYTEPGRYPDRGGPTKGGITLKTLRHWRKAPSTSTRELRNLQKSEAIAILRLHYVECNGIKQLEGTALFAQVVDNAVLSGPYLSVCDLQHVLGVTVDGIIGPKTYAAVKVQGDKVRAKLVRTRALRIVVFVQRHPKQLVFLKGWMSRILSFLPEV
jgi:lysozyme family protein